MSNTTKNEFLWNLVHLIPENDLFKMEIYRTLWIIQLRHTNILNMLHILNDESSPQVKVSFSLHLLHSF